MTRRAEAAYAAYGAVTDFKNFQGNPMPKFEDLTPQINAAIANLTARISIYEAVAMVDPDDPFIQYELQIMWGQLGMLQIEQTDVRFVLTMLSP